MQIQNTAASFKQIQLKANTKAAIGTVFPLSTLSPLSPFQLPRQLVNQLTRQLYFLYQLYHLYHLFNFLVN
jgi:hypothetical protein